jgi:hypothetical protein
MSAWPVASATCRKLLDHFDGRRVGPAWLNRAYAMEGLGHPASAPKCRCVRNRSVREAVKRGRLTGTADCGYALNSATPSSCQIQPKS